MVVAFNLQGDFGVRDYFESGLNRRPCYPVGLFLGSDERI